VVNVVPNFSFFIYFEVFDLATRKLNSFPFHMCKISGVIQGQGTETHMQQKNMSSGDIYPLSDRHILLAMISSMEACENVV
jgi:hypothetical protein